MDALININYSTYKVICQCSLNKAEKSFTLNDKEIFTKLNVKHILCYTLLTKRKYVNICNKKRKKHFSM